ncbi:MAG: hypothetical protein LUE16_08010 [Lachnospiraceae bacterium]|nr:hypothetical protein [Lachnospiraceae bacterium]
MELPESIKKQIGQEAGEKDQIGMSDSSILIFHQNRVSGYIDLGKTGAADRWCDIALCYRSLSQNYTGKYHSRDYGKPDDLLLFQELGIQPDWEKIRYYICWTNCFNSGDYPVGGWIIRTKSEREKMIV